MGLGEVQSNKDAPFSPERERENLPELLIGWKFLE
jgi:hypothetical protein